MSRRRGTQHLPRKPRYDGPDAVQVLLLLDGNGDIGVGGVYPDTPAVDAAARRAMNALFVGYQVHEMKVGADQFAGVRLDNLQRIDDTEETPDEH